MRKKRADRLINAKLNQKMDETIKRCNRFLEKTSKSKKWTKFSDSSSDELCYTSLPTAPLIRSRNRRRRALYNTILAAVVVGSDQMSLSPLPFSREGPKEARFAATQSMPQNLFNFTLFYSCTLTIACTVHFLMLVACRLKRFLTCFFVIQNFVVLLLFLKIN